MIPGRQPTSSALQAQALSRADRSARDQRRLTANAPGMRWRRIAYRLPLTGVAVAGAVVGHMVAYVLA